MIKFESALRPCKVKLPVMNEKHPWRLDSYKTKNALFHCWAQKSDVIPPSMINGGHNGGVVAGLVGIVELSDGQVCEIPPYHITFLDNKHEEYAFPEEKETEEKE